MSNIPLVSVLTPVYNGEKYIEECIKSVLSQTYQNWEYVIVNNKSTDGTAAIIEKYTRIDTRIRVHHNEVHLPVMDNLNNTNRFISDNSKYCKIIHADDWMFPECLDRMVGNAEKYPTVGIVCSNTIAGNIVVPHGVPYPSHFITGRDVARSYLLNGFVFFGPPSSLLVRSDLIRKRELFYDPTFIIADYAACLDVLTESDLSFVHQILSYRRVHPSSVTQSQAWKNPTLIGDLKMVLKYGPFFLTEAELKQRYNNRLRAYYIQFARNILDFGLKKTYHRHKTELKSINIPLRKYRIMQYLIREVVIIISNMMGIYFNKPQ